MRWFKHMSSAHDEEFTADIIEEFGLEGYARWWLILEVIAGTMGEPDGCSATFSWHKWQTLLRIRRQKLEIFLRYLEQKPGRNQVETGKKPGRNQVETGQLPGSNQVATKVPNGLNSVTTGKKLIISCPMLLILRDNHQKNLQARLQARSPPTCPLELDVELEVDIDKEKDKVQKTSPPDFSGSVLEAILPVGQSPPVEVGCGMRPSDSDDPLSFQKPRLEPPVSVPPTIGFTRFAMTATWQPTETFRQRVELSGMTPDELKREHFAEFVSYWMTQPQMLMTQDMWEHKLIVGMKRTAAREAGIEEQNKNAKTRQSDKVAHDQSITDAIVGGTRVW